MPAIAPYAQLSGEEEQQECGRQSAKQRREALARCRCLVVQRCEAWPERQRGEQRDDTQRGQSRCPQATPFRRRELRGEPLARGRAITAPRSEPGGNDALRNDPTQAGEQNGDPDAEPPVTQRDSSSSRARSSEHRFR